MARGYNEDAKRSMVENGFTKLVALGEHIVNQIYGEFDVKKWTPITTMNTAAYAQISSDLVS